MGFGKLVWTITRQRIFIDRSCVSAVKPSLIPVLGEAMMFGVREVNILSLMDSNAPEFSVGPIRKFSTAVSVKEVPA